MSGNWGRRYFSPVSAHRKLKRHKKAEWPEGEKGMEPAQVIAWLLFIFLGILTTIAYYRDRRSGTTQRVFVSNPQPGPMGTSPNTGPSIMVKKNPYRRWALILSGVVLIFWFLVFSYGCTRGLFVYGAFPGYDVIVWLLLLEGAVTQILLRVDRSKNP